MHLLRRHITHPRSNCVLLHIIIYTSPLPSPVLSHVTCVFIVNCNAHSTEGAYRLPFTSSLGNAKWKSVDGTQGWSPPHPPTIPHWAWRHIHTWLHSFSQLITAFTWLIACNQVCYCSVERKDHRLTSLMRPTLPDIKLCHEISNQPGK